MRSESDDDEEEEEEEDDDDDDEGSAATSSLPSMPQAKSVCSVRRVFSNNDDASAP